MSNQVDRVISASQVSHHYGSGHLYTSVLKDISLEVSPKQSIAIVGSSGSGKSTLLHLLGGLDIASQGEIHLMGHNLTQSDTNQRAALRNQYLGFVYQFHHLLPEFSALDNVAMPLWIRGENIKQARLEAGQLLVQVGLSDRGHHKPSELSGGERQRCALARALITRPACLLADEPTGNLDNKTAKQVLDLIASLKEGHDMAMIIVTHDVEVASMMDQTWMLVDGCLQKHS